MRRRRATVELFEEIRREYEFGAGSIQGVARKLGVHRRLVREALSSAVPVRKPAPKRKRPRVGPVMDFIDAILEEDRKAPRKQRHTAHRIYVRLCQERYRSPVSVSTFEGGSWPWVWWHERPSCLSTTTGAAKPRWTGTRPTPNWGVSVSP